MAKRRHAHKADSARAPEGDGADRRARRLQVNIRLTRWERERLDELVRESGCSVTDYLLQSTVYCDQRPPALPRDVLASCLTELRGQTAALNEIKELAVSIASDTRSAVAASSARSLRTLVEETSSDVSRAVVDVSMAIASGNLARR